MKRNIYLLILLSIILQSCKKEKQIKKYKINFKQEINTANFSDITDKDSFEVIPLETTENSLIGNIDKVLFTDKYIFVFDMFNARALFQFNKNGDFIQKIGRQGNAQGEYSMLYDFTIFDNTIYLLDAGARIFTYSFEGKYISTMYLKDFVASKFIKLSKDNFAFNSTGGEYELSISDNNGTRKKAYFPKTTIKKTLEINTLYNIKNDVFFRRSFNDTIYHVINNGNIKPSYVIDYGKKALNLKKYNSNKLIKNNITNFASTVNWYENEEFAYLNFTLNNQFWTAIFNKQSDECIVFPEKNINNDVTFNKDEYVIGTKNNKFVFAIQPVDLIYGLKEIPTDKQNYFYKKIEKIAKKIDENDNPVLVLYKYNFPLNKNEKVNNM